MCTKMHINDIKKGLQKNGTFSIHKYVFESLYYMVSNYSESPSTLVWMTLNKAKNLLKEHGTFDITPKLVGIDDPFVTMEDAAKMIIYTVFTNFSNGNRAHIPYMIEHSITKEKYVFSYEHFLDWFDNIDAKILEELKTDEITIKSALYFGNFYLDCILDITNEPIADL